jgi:hypothetical protein
MEFVSTFFRMIFIIYITYKENIRAECKLVFRIDHKVKIVCTLGEEWLQEKSTAGISGTRNEETVSYHLRQLPAKKENDFCMCSTGTKRGPVKSWRSRTVCISSVRRVFTDGASPKDVCFA